MATYLLLDEITSDDLEFLNKTPIDIEVIDPTAENLHEAVVKWQGNNIDLEGVDHYTILFTNVTDYQKTILLLKYGKRVLQLPEDYNYYLN